MKKEKEIIEYMDEAFDKVWLMRTHPCDNEEIEKERIKSVERILNKYPDIPEKGYSEWECGFYNGVLATLRWVIDKKEENKMFLDT